MPNNFSHPPGASTHYLALLRFCAYQPARKDQNELPEDTALLAALNGLGAIRQNLWPLLPIIYRNLVELQLLEQLDTAVKDSIKSSTMLLVGRELSTRQWLRKTIQSFEAGGIPIILLKGAAFSEYLYSDDAPRPGVDVDFLVKEADFDKACELLSQTMAPLLLSDKRVATHQTLFERVFSPKEGLGPTVELHRGLTNPYIFKIDEATLWDSSEPHPGFQSEQVRVLSPEHTLLHLAVHAFRDMNFCSHNLLDAHSLIQQRELNETRLYEQAGAWGARTVLYYLLRHTTDIMGSRADPYLLKSLAPRGFKRRIQEQLLASGLPQNDAITVSYRTKQLASQLVFPDSLAAAFRFQLHYAATRIRDVVAS